jgi:hypothetical protein
MMGLSGLLNTVLLLALWVAPGVAGQPEQGAFEVRIKDHREAIDDFSRLLLTINGVAISPKPGLKFWQTSWQEFSPSPASVDLTKYIGKDSARILRADIDPGTFDAVHLKVRSVDGLLKKNKRIAPVKNTIAPVKLSFDVAAGSETVLVLDLTVIDFSDHPPRGYELSLKGYELYSNGKLIDKIPPG